VTDASLQTLREHMASLGSAVVAFSAGVDSTLVLAVAVEQLGPRAVAVFGVSPSVPRDERTEARTLAAHLGARLIERSTHELADPSYAANDSQRCRHCKWELYGVCRQVADELGLAAVLDGTQADDLSDTRPGLLAGRERGVHSPLAACGLDKHDVRRLARLLELPNWDKPAMACLASRLPTGTPVTAARLAAVDGVERALRRLGFRQVRARHLGREVLLQVESERVGELLAQHDDPGLARAVTQAGFESARIDPDGYRRGSLHALGAGSHGADT